MARGKLEGSRHNKLIYKQAFCSFSRGTLGTFLGFNFCAISPFTIYTLSDFIFSGNL